jgi:shikimate 5-dehydrogenase
LISGAGGLAKAAMHAAAQNFFGARTLNGGQEFGEDVGFHQLSFSLP